MFKSPTPMKTMFLNMMHGASLKAMPPKLLSDDKRNIVIRPLAYCREKDIKSYAAAREFPIIPCNLCGSQENLQRQATKAMLMDIESKQPQAISNMLKAISNVSPSQLADTDLFDFKNLEKDVDTSKLEIVKKAPKTSEPKENSSGAIQFIEL